MAWGHPTSPESWFYDAVKMICTGGMCSREVTIWPKTYGEVNQQNGANVMWVHHIYGYENAGGIRTLLLKIRSFSDVNIKA